MKTALIAGATGLTGKKLLYALLNNKEYARIFILVRKELAIKDPRLTQIIFNYNNDHAYENLLPADEVYCCLGTTIKKAGSKEAFRQVDLEYPEKLAKACFGKGYKKFIIITALGSDKNSRFFYNKVKGEVEEKTKQIPFESVIICKPSLLLGDREEFRLGEVVGTYVMKFISLFLFGSLKKYKGIQASVVAQAMMVLANEGKSGIQIVDSEKLQKLGSVRGKTIR